MYIYAQSAVYKQKNYTHAKLNCLKWDCLTKLNSFK